MLKNMNNAFCIINNFVLLQGKIKTEINGES